MMTEISHLRMGPTQTQVLPRGADIGAHRHDDHQIVYASRGVLSVTTDEGIWVAPATRAIWVPAGTTHAHRAHGDVDLHLLGLPAAENPLRLATPAVLAVGPLLRELIVAYTSGGARSAPESARLRAVLVDQVRASPQQPLHLPTPTDPLLREVCELVRGDLSESRTLAELGAVVGASERTLSRLFRRDLGMTFPQWRTQLRLHEALVLLAEKTPVTTVAHRCGWASPSAFVDAFRRAFGTTPGAHAAKT